jgi:hypothetical protein
MTPEQFENAVKKMRQCQKAFFAASHGGTEKRNAYTGSKQMEKIVDDYLKSKEPNLFDEADNGQ